MIKLAKKYLSTTPVCKTSHAAAGLGTYPEEQRHLGEVRIRLLLFVFNIGTG
jgi:hypothetical protein